MQEITLTAEPRDTIGSAHARRFRAEGRVPAVVYGLEDPSITVTVDAHEIQRVLVAGANALINLEVGDDSQLTLAREVQWHPIKGDVLHVDFVRIRADQPVEANVPVHLLGEPEGAKEGGILEHVLYDVTISAKPRDIPEYFEVDVSDLGVGEQKRVSDLTVPPEVEIITDPERVVANLVIPQMEEEEGPTLSAEEIEELEGLSEEELEALHELAAAQELEEGEEGEEGEAPEEGAPEKGGEEASEEQ